MDAVVAEVADDNSILIFDRHDPPDDPTDFRCFIALAERANIPRLEAIAIKRGSRRYPSVTGDSALCLAGEVHLVGAVDEMLSTVSARRAAQTGAFRHVGVFGRLPFFAPETAELGLRSQKTFVGSQLIG